MNYNKELPVIYKDDYFVAINKPAGLLVHRSVIAKDEKCFALQMVRDQVGKPVYPVHRLDKPTSGVLLFALSREVARKTSDLFSANTIHKKYLAVVRGYTENAGTIDYSLREVKDAMFNTPKLNTEKRRDAITKYIRVATVELPDMVDKYSTSRFSLVELIPKSGRRHQLRRHMKHISHPIIGDTKYGKGKYNRYFRSTFNCHRLMLAATELRFLHPVTSAEITIKSGLDSGFSLILNEFSWQSGITLYSSK